MTSAWPDRLVAAASLYAIAGGVVTLTGWATDVPLLADWDSDGIAMFPNTALCAVLSGVALRLAARDGDAPRGAARVAAVAVALLGALTLLQHVTGLDLRIDTALFSASWGQAAAAAPMRMGPPASTAFALLGTAMALLGGGGAARRTAAALGVAAAGIASLSLTGYLYGAEQLYTVPRLTGIALQTASIIFALGMGVVASAPDVEPMRTVLEPGAAGMLARRTLPVIIAVSLGLGWFRVELQDARLVDTAFGTALRTGVEIALVTWLLWRAVAMVRRHERALHESEAEVKRQAAQLAAFLETAAIGLHRVGPDGTILWANDAELEMLGYERGEYVGRHIAEFHVDQQNIAAILARVHRGEKLLEHPARMRCKDGTIKEVLIDCNALWDEGLFIHTQGFVRDVTEQLRAEAEREESNRRKDEFIAILAHELRNPLAPVRNAARYLKLKAPRDAELARSIEMIERQIGQMSRLIDDLLDVSRLSRGMLGLRRERVSLSEIVDAAVDDCRHELQVKGHALRVSPPRVPVEVEADRDRLVQVLCNLIGNSIKFTPPGGHIEIAASIAERGVLEMSVKDDGIGIPDDKLDEIFDLFARVDRSLERQGGLGIGLTLVRQLVELHGGTIEAHSAGAGKGSEFVLRLPIVVPPAEMPAIVAEATAAAAPLRILLADDNEDAVESLSMLLEMAGHEVHAALDGEAAVARAEAVRPDVALLDIGMPKANGYEVARRIRSHAWGAAIFLVAVTGWGQDDDKRRAREAGFDEHLVKPVPPEALERMLATVAEARASSRAVRASQVATNGSPFDREP
ncbi:MAG TPA: ATP-binding protein [Candidatus Binatia bacterium]|nr:ATP-binding protein [Candidatus Binatia bacterium]